MANQLYIGGVEVDLEPGTRILPSFQANDLTKPDTIQSDYSPEFSLPGTQRNHALLGRAAYSSSATGLPYRRVMASLVSDGVDLLPLALLYVKGYQSGSYQVQLFAGNRRFIEQLGDKTLQDLDLSRFAHTWDMPGVAQRLTADYWAANGWGYELYDRGRPLDVAALNPYLCLPSVSYGLLWDQLLLEAGFTASDLSQEPLFSRLSVPAPTVAGYPEGFRAARQLVAGHGPGGPTVGPLRGANRDPLELPIPFLFHPAGTDPYRAPTIGGVLVSRRFSIGNESYDYTVWKADTACLIRGEARVRVPFEVDFGRVQGTVWLYKNGQPWLEGTHQEVGSGNDSVLVALAYDREAVAIGDEIHAVLRLENIKGVNKWGLRAPLFSDADQFYPGFDGPLMPPDRWSLELVSEVPPGGRVELSQWLPDMKQLDFFKCLVQLLGLTVQCDSYAPHLHLATSAAVLDNAPRALDWTGKRDTPSGPAGEARNVVFRFGSYAQRNWLKWADDDTVSLGFGGVPRKSSTGAVVAQGYGDGYLSVADTNLPAEGSLGGLPFAASEPSAALAGGLKIPSWQRTEQDGLARYELQSIKPRLTVRGGPSLNLTLREGTSTSTRTTQLSYFAAAEAAVELDLHRFVLPRYWRGLSAMLREARYLKERYRLTQADITNLDYTRPIWDAELGDYFALSRVSEFSADRPTEVELARLHPDALGAPTPPALIGREFFEQEFSILPPAPEFY